MIGCVQFTPWPHSERLINLNIPLKLEDFLLKPDTLCVEMNTAPAGLSDTVENVRELWGTWAGLRLLSWEVRGPQLSITHPCIHSTQQPDIPSQTDTHRTGKVTLVMMATSPSGGINTSSDPWTSVSKVHSGITEFHGNIFSRTFELLSNSHMQTQLTVVEWLLLGRLRSALLSIPRHRRCSLGDADGLEAEVTVLVACGTHASHRQVELPIRTRTDLVEPLGAARGPLAPESQLRQTHSFRVEHNLLGRERDKTWSRGREHDKHETQMYQMFQVLSLHRKWSRHLPRLKSYYDDLILSKPISSFHLGSGDKYSLGTGGKSFFFFFLLLIALGQLGKCMMWHSLKTFQSYLAKINTIFWFTLTLCSTLTFNFSFY